MGATTSPATWQPATPTAPCGSPPATTAAQRPARGLRGDAVTGLASSVLGVEQRGPVRKLVLHRPRQRNALNAPLVDALTDALAEAERDPATRAVLITGAGPSFCAGADLQHLLALADAGESPVPFLRTISDFTRRIELSPLPVVAVLHGHAVAGGLEIALAC